MYEIYPNLFVKLMYNITLYSKKVDLTEFLQKKKNMILGGLMVDFTKVTAKFSFFHMFLYNVIIDFT